MHQLSVTWKKKIIHTVQNAKHVKDPRPISCCTRIYRIISKILTVRLGPAFISRRVIQDNILMAHELVKGYGRKYSSPRCVIQLDLQRAYDSIEWPALEKIRGNLDSQQFLLIG